MIDMLRSQWWRIDLELILRWMLLALVSIGLAGVILVYMVYINDGTVTFRDLMPLFALTIAPLAIFVLRIPLRYVLLAAVVFDIPGV